MGACLLAALVTDRMPAARLVFVSSLNRVLCTVCRQGAVDVIIPSEKILSTILSKILAQDLDGQGYGGQFLGILTQDLSHHLASSLP